MSDASGKPRCALPQKVEWEHRVPGSPIHGLAGSSPLQAKQTKMGRAPTLSLLFN